MKKTVLCFLELIGCRIPEGRMGLGVSLLHPSARTLLERFGFERVNFEVRRYDKTYESLAVMGSLSEPNGGEI